MSEREEWQGALARIRDMAATHDSAALHRVLLDVAQQDPGLFNRAWDRQLRAEIPLVTEN